MDFNLLFAVVGNLSFVLEFEISPIAHQDFLFFEGENSSAHLYRQNNTVFLNVADSNFETYQTRIEDKLEFSWTGFKINGSDMEKIKTSGNVTKLEFDVFTLLSPIMEIDKPREEKIMRTILESNKVNYYYILSIVLLVALLVDLKARSLRLIQYILCMEKDGEGEYEVMQSNYQLMQKHYEEISRGNTI